MFTSSIKRALSLNLINGLSYHSKRKLVVIESDDWGAIRTPSKKVYQKLLNKGIISSNDMFAKYDALASESDFSHLLEVLSSIRDWKGNHPIFTTNSIVTNPDFDKIQDSGYEQYYFESIETTYQKYPAHQSSFNIWKEGIQNKLFYPQYHGREHLNVPLWMEKLRLGDRNVRDAFAHGTYAIDHKMVASLNAYTSLQQSVMNSALTDGYSRFGALFGYNSQSFIAPNYTWNRSVEKELYKLGVSTFQGSKKQNIPVLGREETKATYHYTGQKNKNGQIYLVRNCLFEPSISPGFDYVNYCLRQVDNAFFWKAPVIIGTHRLNYIGFLDENNRIKNLKNLNILLKTILRKHPDVEFITTVELSNIIRNKKTSL